MELNDVLNKLPKHLLEMIIEQPYNEYTAQDHAVWRYVMKQNVHYLPKVAHHSYCDGLKKTGVSIDEIPQMYGMNRILQEIGWAAVAVDGFIPPSAFMEFQAHNVLVIAADIRPINQVGYTPAPDIIHEAAGHAPIIADSSYSGYLRKFGEIGSKAFSSATDFAIYEAIRKLSILKANPYSSADDIEASEKEIERLSASITTLSEMSKIRNLHWWTVEYGLVGSVHEPRIYGAGLLSSIRESFNCLQPRVKKMPYTMEAASVSFDITNEQPQLFVTPDFETLTRVLEDFADTMALRRGGLYGVQQAIDSCNTSTIVLSSGLQITGTFSELIPFQNKTGYFRTNTPTALAFANKELEGHSKDTHLHGFGSPVGNWKGVVKAPELLNDQELKSLGIEEGKMVELSYVSGVVVRGKLRSMLRLNGKLAILSFSDCTVTKGDTVLFEPSWGMYDMAVGERVVSAFQGTADPDAFIVHFPELKDKTIKIKHTESARKLHTLYQLVRDIRDKKIQVSAIHEVWQQVQVQYPEEWLLALEILEVSKLNSLTELASETMVFLDKLKKLKEEYVRLIDNGLVVLN